MAPEACHLSSRSRTSSKTPTPRSQRRFTALRPRFPTTITTTTPATRRHRSQRRRPTTSNKSSRQPNNRVPPPPVVVVVVVPRQFPTRTRRRRSRSVRIPRRTNIREESEFCGVLYDLKLSHKISYPFSGSISTLSKFSDTLIRDRGNRTKHIHSYFRIIHILEFYLRYLEKDDCYLSKYSLSLTERLLPTKCWR